MSDLISRDTVIKILNGGGSSIRNVLGGVSGIWINLMDTIGEIERVQAVEAKPIRHGTWEMCRKMIEGDHAMLLGIYPTCNQCGHVESAVDKTTPYCPICGAKMKEG